VAGQEPEDHTAFHADQLLQAQPRGVVLLDHHPQAIRRGSFTWELTAAIDAFIDNWNDHPIPFAWTKDAATILDSIKRAKTKANVVTDH
jgi:hypothetical protein